MEALLMKIKHSSEVLIGRDEGAREFINQCTSQGSQKARTHRHKIKAEVSLEGEIYEKILQGEKTQIQALIQAGLKKGLPAYNLVQKIMIPAIQAVGDKYDQREYFLPQLIASAETMEKGMQLLTPYLNQENQGSRDLGILATVKGDVHDIGKKIVGLLLRNNGYKIIDLGKSVDENTILAQAIEYKAMFIALSALMTTTMLEMEKVVSLVRCRGLGIQVILGGAVVTQQYADEIGADGYAPDAVKCVELVKRLLQKKKPGIDPA
jgi:5-methyltetrahydrofolate--homocysteine methyltransferase